MMLALKPVYFERVVPEAVLPAYAHGPDEDAGMDLSSVDTVTIQPGDVVVVSTGLKVRLEPGYEGQVRSRGGLAAKNKVFVLNSPGTVDPGYRGVIGVILANFGDTPFEVTKGMRVAQLVIAQYTPVLALENTVENDTSRGEGAYSSTGL